MANNLDVLDAASATQALKTTDNAGVHTPHHNVDASALPTGAATAAKQDTQITAEQAILAKLLAAPATEAKQDTGNTSLASILTTAGAAADAAVVTDANGSLSAKLRGLIVLWLAGLKAGEAHIGQIGGDLFPVTTEFTRPSDTTAYTAGDAVSNDTTTTTMQALANAARVSGGSGYITGIRVTTDKKSITPRIRVHFWNTNGAVVAGDNLAYRSSYADISKRVGYVDMPAMITPADSTNSDQSSAIDMTVRIPYTCAATSLYYTLETLDAFTPASAQKISVTVYADRN